MRIKGLLITPSLLRLETQGKCQLCNGNDATVCPIDYLDLADPDLQPLRRCAAAVWVEASAESVNIKKSTGRSRRSSTYERRYVRPQAGVHDALDGRNESRKRPPIVRGR